MNQAIQIITKADHLFFPGLKALLASIRQNMPDVPVTVLDCGLTLKQREACRAYGVHLIDTCLKDFALVRDGDKIKYTTAIFGLFGAQWECDGINIHLDADVIVLKPLTELVSLALEHGLAGVPDHPPLCLSHQIGDTVIEEQIAKMVSGYDGSKHAFNAGVFAVSGSYYRCRLEPILKQLLPFHGNLWAMDQALLNLAAVAANPDCPYKNAGRHYNVRPRYSRDPNFKGVNALFDGTNWHAEAHDGPVYALHFLGQPKPWHDNYPTTGRTRDIWSYYSKLFDQTTGYS